MKDKLEEATVKLDRLKAKHRKRDDELGELSITGRHWLYPMQSANVDVLVVYDYQMLTTSPWQVSSSMSTPDPLSPSIA